MKKYAAVFIFFAIALFVMIFMPMDAVTISNDCIYDVSTDYDSGGVNFGDQTINTSSDAVIVTVTNTSANGASEPCSAFTPLLSIGGDDAAYFEIDEAQGTCDETSFNSGGTCTAAIVFSPVNTGSYSASLIISRSTVELTSLDLSGNGVEAASGGNDDSDDDSDGCSANASTGRAGKDGFGPAALGLIAMLGLVMATASVRRRLNVTKGGSLK